MAAQNDERRPDGGDRDVGTFLEDIDEIVPAKKTRIYQGDTDNNE